MFGVHTIRPWLPIALVVCSVGTGVAAAGQLTVSVTDGRGAPLAGAIVFLDAAAAARAVKPMPVVEMAQRNKTFVPDVLAVTKGTPVSFPNQDTVRHHVYSFSPVKKFELKLYTGVPAAPVVFDQPGVAVLGCNIHDQMVAWVVVLDTPYHGTTGADGRVVLPDAPAGDYTLRVWHQRLPVGAPAQAQRQRVGDLAAQVAVVLKGLEAP